MSGEKNPEVVGCDASIMRNVWEIRMREFGQRMLLEQERLERSALPAINKQWADRMTAKTGKYKRVERKVTPSDIQPDDNIWKSKQPLVPQGVPLGRGPGSGGKPGIPAKSFSAQAPNLKNKKVQDKSFNKLQLLMSITKTQPSSLVWGKAWKFNKSLPSPAEGASPDWGQCWMFAPYQPRAEERKPWPNEPNLVDPQRYHLWRKAFYKMVEPQALDLNLPADEWQTSWKRFEKIKKDSGEDEEEASKHGFFTSLVETQHQNEILCSSEWSDSWTSTKPGNEGLLNATVADNKDMEREINPEWDECWRLLNHHGSNSFKLPRHQKPLSPEWASSWRAAADVFNNKQSSSQNQHHGFDNHSLERDGFHKITSPTRKRDLQVCDKFEAMSDWSKSWEIPKNNSKPCAEIDKVLKALPPKIDAEIQRVEKIPQVNYLTEKVDPRYEQLRRNVIHHTRRELPESKILLLKHLQKILPPSEWRDSWKVIKHRMRQERRRYKPDPVKPFRESEKGEDSKPNASEWKDSWKFTCRPLNQNPELWQQGWSTSTQVRVNWERHQSEISVEEFPKNGPTSERVWGESWKFSRHQHRSEPANAKDQVGKGKLNVPDNSREHESQAKSISDWQDAWMITKTEMRHDKPSFAQWRESWKWSIYHTPHWTGLVSTEKWVDESSEIQRPKSIMSSEGVKAKMSSSFDNKIFGQRYPEKEWSSSWRTKSLSNQSSKSSSTQQQHPILSECGCKWGRSFRLANPTPQLDQPWIESSQNPGYYQVLWSSKNKIQNINKNKSDLNKVFASATLWANSYRFLQKPNNQLNTKGRSKVLSDQRVILPTKIKTRKQLYSGIEKEKQSERKWAGCHLLGKTQPRPKKGSGSDSKLMPEDSVYKKILEEWGESWRFFVRPENLKKQTSFKSISGWDESWKFLFPPY
ncbi:uncharacterized protein LOC114149628 [Xiphophorus couchianus]|uniref:uncharacterized protein LOC114149628 n=1 Tax=Xiphophorus couchianus TaxID=32473 RepID=UPI00101707B7|nr:uncharacterized protein LOC114149628 [Xiphophorus couchianus]